MRRQRRFSSGSSGERRRVGFVGNVCGVGSARRPRPFAAALRVACPTGRRHVDAVAAITQRRRVRRRRGVVAWRRAADVVAACAVARVAARRGRLRQGEVRARKRMNECPVTAGTRTRAVLLPRRSGPRGLTRGAATSCGAPGAPGAPIHGSTGRTIVCAAPAPFAARSDIARSQARQARGRRPYGCACGSGRRDLAGARAARAQPRPLRARAGDDNAATPVSRQNISTKVPFGLGARLTRAGRGFSSAPACAFVCHSNHRRMCVCVCPS
jgi:hypothetical protein